MIDIIIFAIVACFVTYKLYKTLGNTKYDNDLSNENKKAYEDFKEFILKDVEQNSEKNNNLATVNNYDLTDDDKQVIENIKVYNPNFTLDKFIKGAKNAFEAVLKAYNESDETTLKQLLGENLLESFLQDLQHYKSNSQKKNITLVSIQDIKLISVNKVDSNVQIKVRFESEQISSVTDLVSGQLISGSFSKIIKRIDTFTFAKKINSKSNMWILINNES